MSIKNQDYLNKDRLNISDEIRRVCSNSKYIKEDDIYILTKEYNISDTLMYIYEAYYKKCSKIILHESLKDIIHQEIPLNIMNIIEFVNYPYNYYFELLYNYYNKTYQDYNIPKIIGITGTSGKTTVTTLVYEVLKKCNKNVTLIGSNGIYKYHKSSKMIHISISNTTPSIELTLSSIYDKEFNPEFVIMEVSSEGIINDRIRGIKFDLVGFLNLSIEHLNTHHNLNEYANVKNLLFKQCNNTCIINLDDEYNNIFLESSKNYFNTILISNNNELCNYSYNVISNDSNELVFEINDKTKCKKMKVYSSLLFDFNAFNETFSYAILNHYLDCDKEYIDVVKRFKVIGRCENYNINKRIVIIDYAHTPEEMRKVLINLRSLYNSNILVVCGAGGNRCKNKRSFIGLHSVMNANYVIFTEDNNRLENGYSIIQDIIKDIKDYNNYDIVLDRIEAIKQIVNHSCEGDVICLLGKGYEFINHNKKTTNYTDYDIVYNELNGIKYEL